MKLIECTPRDVIESPRAVAEAIVAFEPDVKKRYAPIVFDANDVFLEQKLGLLRGMSNALGCWVFTAEEDTRVLSRVVGDQANSRRVLEAFPAVLSAMEQCDMGTSAVSLDKDAFAESFSEALREAADTSPGVGKMRAALSRVWGVPRA